MFDVMCFQARTPNFPKGLGGFFSFFALVGLGAIAFWGLLSFWISGVIMGIVFLLCGIALAVTAGLALCKIENGRARNRRLWACMRFFFGVLCVVSLALFLDYVLNLNSQFSENIGWVLLGTSSLLAALLTRPPWRARFCVWLSGLTHKVGDKRDALDAAMLIWVDIAPGTAPDAEMSSSNKAGSSTTA